MGPSSSYSFASACPRAARGPAATSGSGIRAMLVMRRICESDPFALEQFIANAKKAGKLSEAVTRTMEVTWDNSKNPKTEVTRTPEKDPTIE